MRWAEPWWFFLLSLIILPWTHEVRGPRLGWPSIHLFPKSTRSAGVWKRWLTPLLRSVLIAVLVAALARPQTVAGQTRVAAQGVSILLLMDRSSSMTAVEPGDGSRPTSRLETARRTIDRFVAGRPGDLLGLVAFANYPDLVCPPTLDHETLRAAIQGVRPAGPIDDGTNIGDAVAWALDAIRNTRPKRKVLVLLTDGANEPAVPNPLDPIDAASLARELDIVIHTVALGPAANRRGFEPTTGLPVAATTQGPDLELLTRIAETARGTAFQAASLDQLDAIFEEIDRLEKSPVEGTIRTRYEEQYGPLVAAGLLLLGLERLMALSRFHRIP